jgi:SAM-dependent methyltransferase
MTATLEATRQAHEKLELFWTGRSRRGETYVGHVHQNYRLQQQAIESLLRVRLKPDDYFTNGMDFGCGYGRFIPLLSLFCGHVWAVDLLPDMLERASKQASNVTPIRSAWPFRFPARGPSMDFVWACLVFQHIVDEDLFQKTAEELRRVIKPGARVLILDNAMDKAPHVKPRGEGALAAALGLQAGYWSERVTINQRPKDHILLDGIKA